MRGLKWLHLCGGAEATIVGYEKLARWFLRERGAGDDIDVLGTLTGVDVVALLLHESERVSVGAAKGGSPSCHPLFTALLARSSPL